MKKHLLLIVILLTAIGCTRTTDYSAGFSVTTVVPSEVSDSRNEAQKMIRMLVSARLKNIAVDQDAQLSTARLDLRTDKSNQHIEVSAIASSEDIALRAARAYANAVSIVIKDQRAEFGILRTTKVAVGPASRRASR